MTTAEWALVISGISILVSIVNRISNHHFNSRMQDKALKFQEKMQKANIQFQEQMRADDLERARERQEDTRQEAEEQAREERIRAVVDDYSTKSKGRNLGVSGLYASGITDLQSSEEVMESISRIEARTRADPIGGYRNEFKDIDALQAFRLWPAEQKKGGKDFRHFLWTLASQDKE